MKHLAPLLFSLFLSAPVFAGEAGEPPRFRDVAEFLTWADKKLADDDYDGLVAAQADTGDKPDTKLAYVKQLDTELGKRRLVDLFKGREFPKDSASATLGGHDKELGHSNIDFVKMDGSGRLEKIWQCR